MSDRSVKAASRSDRSILDSWGAETGSVDEGMERFQFMGLRHVRAFRKRHAVVLVSFRYMFQFAILKLAIDRDSPKAFKKFVAGLHSKYRKIEYDIPK